ncbi:MAG: hypothetical protein MESAZ_01184 [Saezia sanguinis]
MENIPTSATETEIALFIEQLDFPNNHINIRFAAIAYLGMCRHEYMSHEWMANHFAWEKSLRDIGYIAGEKNANTIRDRITQTYRSKGYCLVSD